MSFHWKIAGLLGLVCLISACARVGQQGLEQIHNSCARAYDLNAYSDTYINNFWAPVIRGNGSNLLSARADFEDDFSLSAEARTYRTELNQALKKRGIDQFVIMVPQRSILVDNSRFGLPGNEWFGDYSFAKAVNSYRGTMRNWPAGAVFDAYPIMARDPQNAFNPRDHHWTQSAIRNVAAAAGPQLAARPSLKNVPRYKYTISIGNRRDMGQQFRGVYASVCGYNESIPAWGKSYRAVGAPRHGFDAGKYVALVGNSQVSEGQGFSEWIRKASGLPIENFYLRGGDQRRSLLELVHVEVNENKRPPALVLQAITTWEGTFWEPEHYDREVVLALNGECSADTALKSVPPTLGSDGVWRWSVTGLGSGKFFGRIDLRRPLRIGDPIAMPQDAKIGLGERENTAYMQSNRTGLLEVNRSGDARMNTRKHIWVPINSGGESWAWYDQIRNPVNARDIMHVCKGI